jgi:perosamine synthetase
MLPDRPSVVADDAFARELPLTESTRATIRPTPVSVLGTNDAKKEVVVIERSSSGTADSDGGGRPPDDEHHLRSSLVNTGRALSLGRLPRSPVLGTGSVIRAKSSKWARLDQQGACVYTSSGRAAIVLALRAVGVGDTDEVLVPTYHCPTMVEAAVCLGAIPVFYTVCPDGRPDLETLRAFKSTKAKAMIAAHFFGLAQDLRPVRRFCDERGIALIEDCAHAFFGHSPAGPVGAMGDFSIGSLPKFFPVVEGGCLVRRSPQRALPKLLRQGLIRELRVAWDALQLGADAGSLGAGSVLVASFSRAKDRLRGLPAHSRLSRRGDISAAEVAAACNTIDLSLVEKRATSSASWLARHADVERIASARRTNYRMFSELLGDRMDMRPLFPELKEGDVPYVFPLFVNSPQPLYRALRIRGIPIYRWDICWPGTPLIAGDSGGIWSSHVFQMACHEDLKPEDIGAVVSAIREESR